MGSKPVCKRCQQEKDVSDFYWTERGYRSSPYCKPCKAILNEEKKISKKMNEEGEELFDFGKEAKFYDYQRIW